MLGLLLTLAVGASASPVPADQTGPWGPPPAHLVPEVAAERVAACGFTSVRAKFDDELQEEVVEVRNLSSASPEQLRCAAVLSLDSNYYVIFPAPVSETYETLYRRIAGERGKAGARAWLDKRGLLSRLPAYDPKRSDLAAVAQRLEALCGPRAAGTLKLGHGMATFREDALGRIEKGAFTEGTLDGETMVCLVNAAAASDFPLVLFGNEAYRQGR
jgi:hypothetical protein